jgi:RNA polymerase sigma-70 factor (ECF subfamily)
MGATDCDDQLVLLAKAGDYSAFETLYDRHRMLVFRYSYQMMPNRDEAEDMVQEVFVRAYQNLHRYRDEAKFTTWLLRIATNLATDRARMSSRRTTLEQREATGGLAWMTIGEFDDPIQNLEGGRRIVALKKALAAMPAHHRQAIVLRDIEEREYSDIAEILSCTIGGAKLRVLRARRVLRDRVGPMLEDPTLTNEA